MTATMGRKRKPRKANTPEREFAARLLDLRERAKMSIPDLVDKLAEHGVDVSRPALYHWESGTRTPRIKALRALAAIYKKSLDELLG